MKKVVIDGKNLARYSGGIAEYIKPLLLAWIKSRPEISFLVAAPFFDYSEFVKLPNCEFFQIPWPDFLPRFMRHPIYDNILFPCAINKLKPCFIFSPYHDLRLPNNIPFVMMIHDTCIGELKGVYPYKIRAYYDYMLRSNIPKSKRIITVSESSKTSIVNLYKISPDLISIVPNSLPESFRTKFKNDSNLAKEIKNNQAGQLRLFYSGGSDYRKNIRRLILALETLVLMGIDAHLWVTGVFNDGWLQASSGMKNSTISRIHFLGYLSHEELRIQYLATDVVVYPSLGEGFGRVCLESMVLGVPLACSDLPVFREVADSYADYFNPYDIKEMASVILASSRKLTKEPKNDSRFEEIAATQKFVDIINVELNDVL